MKDSLTRARNYIYWLVSRQSRTKKEIADKLKRKEYEENIISQVLKEAEENGLVNDKRYAFAYALDRMNFFKSGKNLVRMKLQQKGVEKTVTEKAIETAYKGVDEYAQALDIAKRRARSYRKLEKQVIARRLTSYIVRRGFSFDTALRVTKAIVKEAEYQE
ncbi:MAG: regulatory protein RecX [Candidatus Firestonebacteria bacterium]